MKTRRKGILKPFAAAAGLGLAMAASSASAAINWGDFTLFEDDDVDFHMDAQGNLKVDQTIDIGDVLAAVLELNTANGSAISPPEELTGLSIIQLVARIDLDGNGTPDDIFAPAALGFDFYADALGATAPALSAGGGAGEGAMVAFWVDPAQDLVIDAGAVVGGTTSCTTYAGCVAQATNGTEWMVTGFTGDPDEGWVVLNPLQGISTGVIDVANPSQSFGTLNTGQGIIVDGTAVNLAQNALSCGVLCGPGGDGFVDVFASGSVKGGGETFTASDWFATSDFDMTLAREIPVPGTMLLMGLGLLGMGSMSRRKKA